MSEPSAQFVKVKCSCGAKLKLPVTSAGRKAKCPKCQKVFRIPAAPTADAASTVAADDDSAGSLLDELAEHQSASPAASEKATPAATRCPKCGADLPDAAVICVSCGYNLQSGRILKQASGAGTATRRLSVGAGTFPVGCTLSLVGALIGAVIWFAVAVITQYEIGWIALLLGLLAGGGMAMGSKKRDARAGTAAAVIALVAILVAKAMVFAQADHEALRDTPEDALSLVGGGFEDETDSESAVLAEFARLAKAGRVASHRAQKQAMANGWRPGDREWNKLEGVESRRAAKLTNEELDPLIAQIDAWEAGGKWNDPAYVRDFLIYRHIYDALEELRSEGGYLHDEYVASAWKRLYEKAVVAIDALSPEEQRARILVVQQEEERDSNRFKLALRHTNIRAIKEALPIGDERKWEIEREEHQKYEHMSAEAVDEAMAELDAWEAGGKWDDAEYVRGFLIREQTTRAMLDWQPRDPDAGFSAERREAWDKEHAANVYKVDSMSPEQQRARAIALAQPEAADEEVLAEIQAEATQDSAMETFNLFIKSSFGLLDLIFAALAVVSAFGLVNVSNE